jgi:hypothetical protein
MSYREKAWQFKALNAFDAKWVGYMSYYFYGQPYKVTHLTVVLKQAGIITLRLEVNTDNDEPLDDSQRMSLVQWAKAEFLKPVSKQDFEQFKIDRVVLLSTNSGKFMFFDV